MSARDNQRARLYAAERTIDGIAGDEFGSTQATQKWVDDVIGERWFRSRWKLRNGLRVQASTSGAHSYNGKVTVARDCRNPLVMCHELAHEVMSQDTAGDHRLAPHGPEFAAIYLYLVKMVLGKDKADELRAAFVAQKVRHRVAVQGPRYRVTTAAAKRAARREKATRPIGEYERTSAVDVLRRAITRGEFGPVGTKTRTHALQVARTLEKSGQ